MGRPRRDASLAAKMEGTKGLRLKARFGRNVHHYLFSVEVTQSPARLPPLPGSLIPAYALPTDLCLSLPAVD